VFGCPILMYSAASVNTVSLSDVIHASQALHGPPLTDVPPAEIGKVVSEQGFRLSFNYLCPLKQTNGYLTSFLRELYGVLTVYIDTSSRESGLVRGARQEYQKEGAH